MASVTRKAECEIVIENIITILKRTGDEWRKLEWDEYKTERLKDGHFSDIEQGYFNRVVEYTYSFESASLFCPNYKAVIAKALAESDAGNQNP